MFKLLKTRLIIGSIPVLSLSLAQGAIAATICLLPGNDPNQTNAMQALLEGAGHSVTVEVQYFQFDGPQSLAGYQAAILLNSANWAAGDMPLAGQNQLVNFVQGGHGLITGEWVLWNWKVNNRFQTLYSVLPATTDGSYNYTTPITYTRVEADAVLNAGLPDSFLFPVTGYAGREENIWAKAGAHTFYDSSNLTDGLAGWQTGAGRVLYFSTPIGPDELEDPEYQQLFKNAVAWVVVPLPGASGLLGSGLLLLVGLRRLSN